MPASLQYVILRHDGIAEPHFDLMFETEPGGALMTFRSPSWPITQLTQLEKLSDHRSAYLTYEGPLTNDRGRVTRVDSGTFTSTMNSNDPWVCDVVLNDTIRLRLTKRLAESWTIQRAQ